MKGEDKPTCAPSPHNGRGGLHVARIRELNDALRMHGHGAGHIVITRGVSLLGAAAVDAIVGQLRAFDTFTLDNDPFGEHDMGTLEWRGLKLFWKIDYYDRKLQFASPDPADPSLTTRVLTVMLAVEY